MPDRRNLRVDGIAWLLLFCGLVVALCVLSHEPTAGSPNLLGVPGDWLARELYATLGSAVYVLLVAWFVLVLMLLVRKTWLRWTCRLCGWLILLPCTAIAADFLGHDWLPGPLYGSGGILGAVLRESLQDQMPGALGWIVYGASAFLGLLLAADFLVRGFIDLLYYICFGLSFFFALIVRRRAARLRFVSTTAGTRKRSSRPRNSPTLKFTRCRFSTLASSSNPKSLSRRRPCCRSRGSACRMCRSIISTTTSCRR